MPRTFDALRRVIATALFCCVVISPAAACTARGNACGTTPPQWKGDQSWAIERALMSEQRLWLLTDTGELSSIAEGQDTRVPERLPELVVDMCLRDDALIALTGRVDGCGAITVRRREDGRWKTEASISRREREHVTAMSCDAQQTAVLMSQRLVVLSAGGVVASTRLESALGGGVTSMQLSKGHAFVGINAGEWGGGLLRIDRSSGAVTRIEKNDSGEPCAGPLNPSCDPVNGIVTSPWQAGCVVAAIGLVHFAPHGRVVEVCGDAVRRLYVKAFGEQPPPRPGHPPPGRGDEPFSTVAFFGLQAVGDAVLATGTDGLYRIRHDGSAEVVPLPEFHDVGGVGVSFEHPDYVLVITGINGRLSMSGGTPMLVPRANAATTR